MLTWQADEEWWGIHYKAYDGDYKISVMWMKDANTSFWRIEEDSQLRARGTCPGAGEKAQALVSRQLRVLKMRDRINNLLRKPKHVAATT